MSDAPPAVLIADDERPARRKIRRLLEASGDTSVIYEAGDGRLALEIIRSEAPDLVFLDIQMPGLTGLDVARALPPDAAPFIVFITAFDQHAVHAFDLSAVDYLLKPFDTERFARAYQRARSALAARTRDEQAALRQALSAWRPDDSAPLDRLLVDDGSGTALVRLDDVARFDAHGNYVRVTSTGGAYQLRATMDGLERRLDPARFARVSRSCIVNLDHIAGLTPAGHGDAIIRLRNGDHARLSRRYRDRIERYRASG